MMLALDDLGFDYDHDESYVLKHKGYMRWDIIIWTGFNHDPVFMEYDGRQHFEPVGFGGISDERAQSAFETGIHRDSLKDQFCQDNGYLMLRISYLDFDIIHQLVSEFTSLHLIQP
jgi:hypothetical protein